MLKKQSLYRPDKQLEKMLLNLVYSLIAMAISVLLLFAFPHHSLVLHLMFLSSRGVYSITMYPVTHRCRSARESRRAMGDDSPLVRSGGM